MAAEAGRDYQPSNHQLTMGDRCYMTVTCRWQDRARFEKLGFRIMEDNNLPVVELVDEQAIRER
jgi:hypothetical protein